MALVGVVAMGLFLSGMATRKGEARGWERLAAGYADPGSSECQGLGWRGKGVRNGEMPRTDHGARIEGAGLAARFAQPTRWAWPETKRESFEWYESARTL